MNSPKIFYSIDDSFPPYRVDVAELFGKSLAAIGMDVEWYMRRGAIDQSSMVKFMGQVVHLPICVNRRGLISKTINKLAFWACDLWQMVRCLGRKIDLIQVRDKYIAAVFGLLVARIKGVPFTYWCSYPFPEHYLESAKLSRGVRKFYCRFHGTMGKLILYRLVMPRSDHVFVQSEQMKRDIAAYGVPESKMTPVPMGVPEKIFTVANQNKLEIQPGRFVYIGTLAAVRRMSVLIESFAKVHDSHPDARLVIVGDGDVPQERVALEQLAQQLGLENVINFTGFLPIERAWEIAASAQCCVSPFYPSPILNVASPTKLNEYMALGRPVVCNHHPEQTEVISDSGAGLCVPWGKDEFAEAMIWMLEHPAEAEAMGAKGPAWVAAHRTYPIIAEKVFRKYQEILRIEA